MLIVLEGLDGAGKSTQVKMMRSYLERVSPRVKYIHFPRYDAPVYGDLIGKFLRGGFGSLENVHPQLVALLYAEDRHNAADEMKAAINAGETVLLDRYVYSNIAYQCAKLSDSKEIELLRQWIIDTEYGAFALPKPDLNIFLDVPFEFIRKNLKKDRSKESDREYLQGSKDINEENILFQQKVRNVYLQQVKRDKTFIAIPCGNEEGEILPPDEIFSKIKAVYENYKKD